MSKAEIRSLEDRLADMARLLSKADPEDKAELFRQLSLKLTHHPGRKIVEAEVWPTKFAFFDGVRGGIHQKPMLADLRVCLGRLWRCELASVSRTLT
jgi:hypothetical protein